MKVKIAELEEKFHNADMVWFLVAPNFRIIAFNERATVNSQVLHNKKLMPGDSILDFVRDTKNDIDESFIANFGKAATGEPIIEEKDIVYESSKLKARSQYSAIFVRNQLLGISITVDILTEISASA